MSKDESGSAFPHSWNGRHFPGLSKREYFAGQALAGLMANPNIVSLEWFNQVADGVLGGKTIARVCAAHADAMIEEGSK